MKSMLVLLVAMLVGMFANIGCHNPVESTDQRFTRIGLLTKINIEEAVDDWDYFWLIDRNSNLTQWHPRVGR